MKNIYTVSDIKVSEGSDHPHLSRSKEYPDAKARCNHWNKMRRRNKLSFSIKVLHVIVIVLLTKMARSLLFHHPPLIVNRNRVCGSWCRPSLSSSMFTGIVRRNSNNLLQHRNRKLFSKTTLTMMPEGPEVRTMVDQLQPAVGLRLANIQFQSGRYVKHDPPVGFLEFSKTMSNYKKDNGPVDMVRNWDARGKFIYIVLDDGDKGGKQAVDVDDGSGNSEALTNTDFQRSIWITLGMTGRFLHENNDESDTNKSRWYFEFWDTNNQSLRRIYYNDTRNFGTLRFSLSKLELETKLKNLGPDILASLTKTDFLTVIDAQKPDLNICKFLMNQKKISGVGNYILAEGLYRANIDPFASISELNLMQKSNLFEELQEVARSSYASHGLTRDGGSYRDTDGNEGNFRFELQCYGRDVCAKGREVLRETNGPHKRTIWFVEDQLFMSREARGHASELKIVDDALVSDDNTEDSESDINLVDASAMNDSAIQLASTLTSKSWVNELGEYFSSSGFNNLASFIDNDRTSGNTIYPPENEIFAAFNLCPLDKVKVVILGQDPYHQPGQGHGLAFSVKKGVAIPPSLRNIFSEISSDIGISKPTHGCLDHWSKQGILLLNTALTVRKGKANSHSKQGWEDFTSRIIKILNESKENGVVFLLWGGPAGKRSVDIDMTKHVVIKTSHPSPLGATKTSSPFLGSRCFSRCNADLMNLGYEPIDWSIPS